MTTLTPNRRADAVSNYRAILDAALHVLAEDPNATLGKIATEAGVHRRTLYLHFKSREELILATARDVGEQIAARVATVPACDEPLLTLATFVYANSSAVAQLNRFGRLPLVEGARAELSAATAVVRQRIARLLEDAQRRGQLDTRIPPYAGMHSAATVQWGVFEAVAEGDITPEEAPLVAVRSVLGSVGAEPGVVESIVSRLQLLPSS